VRGSWGACGAAARGAGSRGRLVDPASCCVSEARACWCRLLEDVEEEIAVGVGLAAREVGVKRDRTKAPVIGERAVLTERADLVRLEPADLQTCL
jgi:hypothetical protein